MESTNQLTKIRLTHSFPRRQTWTVLSLALLLLLVWGGTAAAATLEERIKPEPGVLIVSVANETPAAEAGLARGDILLAIDGDRVNTAAELRQVILMQDPGDTLELTVKRGEEELTLTVTLADQDGYPLLGVGADASIGQPRLSRKGRPFGMPGFGRAPFRDRFRGMDRFSVIPGSGAMIADVLADSPAAEAGLLTGDVITSVGETAITGMGDLADAIAAYSPGDEVELAVERDGEAISLTVTLGAHPDDAAKAFIGVAIAHAHHFRMGPDGAEIDRRRQPGGRFGFGLPQWGRFDSRFFAGGLPEGALVMGVQDAGPASVAELQEGDVIIAVDESEITNRQDLVDALANHSPGDEVVLTVNRMDEILSATVTLGSHPDDETKAFLGVSIMPMDRFRPFIREEDGKGRWERQVDEDKESESNS